MRITCPSCSAAYEVPAGRVHPRRKVRCTQCGAEWVPVREADPAAASGSPAPRLQPQAELEPGDLAGVAPGLGNPMPAPGDTSATVAGDGHAASMTGITAMDRLAAAAHPRSSGGLRAAWILTLLILVGSAGAAFAWRDALVHAWPPSARILGGASAAEARP